MPYNKESAEKLYNTLINDEYDPADIGNNADEFSKKLQDKDFAGKLHGTLIEDDYDPADIGDNATAFCDTYAMPVQQTAPQPQKQTTPVQPQQTTVEPKQEESTFMQTANNWLNANFRSMSAEQKAMYDQQGADLGRIATEAITPKVQTNTAVDNKQDEAKKQKAYNWIKEQWGRFAANSEGIQEQAPDYETFKKMLADEKFVGQFNDYAKTINDSIKADQNYANGTVIDSSKINNKDIQKALTGRNGVRYLYQGNKVVGRIFRLYEGDDYHWVDEQGNVVESAAESKSTTANRYMDNPDNMKMLDDIFLQGSTQAVYDYLAKNEQFIWGDAKEVKDEKGNKGYRSANMDALFSAWFNRSTALDDIFDKAISEADKAVSEQQRANLNKAQAMANNSIGGANAGSLMANFGAENRNSDVTRKQCEISWANIVKNTPALQKASKEQLAVWKQAYEERYAQHLEKQLYSPNKIAYVLGGIEDNFVANTLANSMLTDYERGLRSHAKATDPNATMGASILRGGVAFASEGGLYKATGKVMQAILNPATATMMKSLGGWKWVRSLGMVPKETPIYKTLVKELTALGRTPAEAEKLAMSQITSMLEQYNSWKSAYRAMQRGISATQMAGTFGSAETVKGSLAAMTGGAGEVENKPYGTEDLTTLGKSMTPGDAIGYGLMEGAHSALGGFAAGWAKMIPLQMLGNSTKAWMNNLAAPLSFGAEVTGMASADYALGDKKSSFGETWLQTFLNLGMFHLPGMAKMATTRRWTDADVSNEIAKENSRRVEAGEEKMTAEDEKSFRMRFIDPETGHYNKGISLNRDANVLTTMYENIRRNMVEKQNAANWNDAMRWTDSEKEILAKEPELAKLLNEVYVRCTDARKARIEGVDKVKINSLLKKIAEISQNHDEYPETFINKLIYRVDGTMLAATPVTNISYETTDNGTIMVATDEAGRVIDRQTFKTSSMAEEYAQRYQQQLDVAELNKTAGAITVKDINDHAQEWIMQYVQEGAELNQTKSGEELTELEAAKVDLANGKLPFNGMLDDLLAEKKITQEEYDHMKNQWGILFHDMSTKSEAVQKIKQQAASENEWIPEQIDAALMGHSIEEATAMDAKAIHIGGGRYRTRMEQQMVEAYKAKVKEASENLDKPAEVQPYEIDTNGRNAVKGEIAEALNQQSAVTPTAHRSIIENSLAQQTLDDNGIDTNNKQELMRIAGDENYDATIREAAQKYLNTLESAYGIDDAIRDAVKNAVEAKKQQLLALESHDQGSTEGKGFTASFETKDGKKGYIIEGDPYNNTIIKVVYDGETEPQPLKADQIKEESIEIKDIAEELANYETMTTAQYVQRIDAIRHGGEIIPGEQITLGDKTGKVLGLTRGEQGIPVADMYDVEVDGKVQQMSKDNIYAARDAKMVADIEAQRTAEENRTTIEAEAEKKREEAKNAPENIKPSDITKPGETIILYDENGNEKLYQVMQIDNQYNKVHITSGKGEYLTMSASELKAKMDEAKIRQSVKKGNIIELPDGNGGKKMWELFSINGNQVTLKSEEGKFMGMTMKDYQNEVRKSLGLPEIDKTTGVDAEKETVTEEKTEQQKAEEALEESYFESEVQAESERIKRSGRDPKTGKFIAFPVDEQGRVAIKKEDVPELYDMLLADGEDVTKFASGEIERIEKAIEELSNKEPEGDDINARRESANANRKEISRLWQQRNMMRLFLDEKGNRQLADKNFTGLVDNAESNDFRKVAPEWADFYDKIAKKFGIKLNLVYGTTTGSGSIGNGLNNKMGRIDINVDAYKDARIREDITPEHKRLTALDYLNAVMGHEVVHSLFMNDADAMSEFMNLTKKYLGEKYYDIRNNKLNNSVISIARNLLGKRYTANVNEELKARLAELNNVPDAERDMKARQIFLTIVSKIASPEETKEIMRRYKPDYTTEDVDEEVCCDMAGQLFSDKSFLKMLLEEPAKDPEGVKPRPVEEKLSMLDKMRNAVENVFNKMRGINEPIIEEQTSTEEKVPTVIDQMRDELAKQFNESAESIRKKHVQNMESYEKRMKADEERRKREMEDTERRMKAAQARYDKMINDARKEFEGDDEALEVLDDRDPRTLEEAISLYLPARSLFLKDYVDGAGRKVMGLEGELGLKFADINRLSHYIGKRENGAKTVNQVAEEMYADFPENIKAQYGQMDVANALRDMLMTAHSADDIRHMIDRNRIDEAREIFNHNEAMAEAYYQSIKEGEADTKLSVRTKPAPKKTVPCYKLMRLGDDGKLYPLFIDAAVPTELGVWYDADAPDLEWMKPLASGTWLVDPKTKQAVSYDDFYAQHPELFKGKQTKYPTVDAVNWASKNGLRFMNIEDTQRAQKRFDGETRKYWNLGINGSGTVSTFSMRPGWHAGSLPTMRQIGKGKNKDLRDDKFVWVEGELSADKDYNAEVQQNPDKDMPDRIPEDGFYLKATNADKAKSQADVVGWYVAGAFKANRIMSDAEANSVIDKWNAEHPEAQAEYDYKRESGKMFNAETMQLEDMPRSAEGKYSVRQGQRMISDIVDGPEKIIRNDVGLVRWQDRLTDEGQARMDLYGNKTLNEDRLSLKKGAKIAGGIPGNAARGAFIGDGEGRYTLHGQRASVISENTIRRLNKYRDDLQKIRDAHNAMYNSKAYTDVYDAEIKKVDDAIKWYEEFAKGGIDDIYAHDDAGVKFSVREAVERKEANVDDEKYKDVAKAADGTFVASKDKETGDLAFNIAPENTAYSIRQEKEKQITFHQKQYSNEELRNKFIDESNMTDEQKAAVKKIMSDAVKMAEEQGATSKQMEIWNNAMVTMDEKGKPVFTVVIPDDEYPMNFGISLVCKRRRALDAVMGEISRSGLIDQLASDPMNIVAINQIIKDHGLEVACDLCYVEARRFRSIPNADKFTGAWNKMIESLDPTEKYGRRHHNFGENKKLSAEDAFEGEGIESAENGDLDFTYIDNVLAEYEKYKKMTKAEQEQYKKDGRPGAILAKQAQFIKDHPEVRKLLDRSDFADSEGFSNAHKRNDYILSLFNSTFGASNPKNSFGDRPYNGDFLTRSWKTDKAFHLGGVRFQSFDDYIGKNWFDYLAAHADLMTKGMPAHSYSKEELYVKTFGLTGNKINMSMVPDAVGDYPAGLDANGDYLWHEGYDIEVDRKGRRKIVRTDKQTFGWKDAREIRSAKGYRDNCGTIAVGVSDAHIWKMMFDPDIDMIIPYHASSLNKVIAHAMGGVGKFTDYTAYQIEHYAMDKGGTKKAGKGLTKGDKKKVPSINKLMTGKEHGGRGMGVRQAVEYYVRWCEKNGIQPKFEQFCYKREGDRMDGKILTDENGNKIINDGYYKFLADFKLIAQDEAGMEYDVPQQAVKLNMPKEGDAFGTFAELTQRGVNEWQEIHNDIETEMPGIVKDIKDKIVNGGSLVKQKYAEAQQSMDNWGVNYTKAEVTPKATKGGDGRGMNYVIFDTNDAKIVGHEKYSLRDKDYNHIFTPNKRDFDEQLKAAYDEKGLVRDNLDKLEFEIVNLPNHDLGKDYDDVYKNYTNKLESLKGTSIEWKGDPTQLLYFGNDAQKKARNSILRYQTKLKALENENHESDEIKSVRKEYDTFLSVINDLENVLSATELVETHVDSPRDVNTGNHIQTPKYNKDTIIHRLYGAVRHNDNIYRTLFTIKETRGKGGVNSMHSYEVTEIELVDTPSPNLLKDSVSARGVEHTSNSISGANLLKNVLKSKEKVNILDASRKDFNNDGLSDDNYESENSGKSESEIGKLSVRGALGANEQEIKLLDQAKKMLEGYGENPNDDVRRMIKMVTGWEQGADGKWRLESEDFPMPNKTAKPKTLGEAYPEDHVLFKAYPSLKDIELDYSKRTASAGSYKGDEGKITISKEIWGGDYGNNYLQRVIQHEVQHAIQHIEGFARGGNSTSMKQVAYEDLKQRSPEVYGYLKLFEGITSFKNLKLFGKGWAERLAKQYESTYPGVYNTISNMSESEYGAFVDKAKRESTKITKAGNKGYNNLAGEVESRNVEKRMGMTMEDRMSSLLSDTEDVGRDKQIVKFSAREAEPAGDIHTDNFKNWFGDWQKEPEKASKVVDKDGKPMVVYHGTMGQPQDMFNIFESGMFASNEDVAKYFNGDEFERPGKTYKVFLNIKKPLVVNAYKHVWNDIPISEELATKLGIKSSFSPHKKEDGNIFVTTDDIVKALRENGKEYDGVIIKDVYETDYGDVLTDDFAVLSPTQIKSATDNNGDYDPNNPDIRYSTRQNVNADAQKAVVDQIKGLMDNKLLKATQKSDLTRLLNQVLLATPENMAKQMEKVTRTVRKIQSAVMGAEISNYLNLKNQDVNGRNMSIAKNVDNQTRQVMNEVKDRMYGVTTTDSDEALHKLGSELWHLRAENRQLQNEIYTAERNGFPYAVGSQEYNDAKAKIEENNNLIAPKAEEYKGLKKTRNDEVAKQIMYEGRDVQQQIDELMQKMDEAVDPDNDVKWTDEDQVKLMTLDILKDRVDIEKDWQDWYTANENRLNATTANERRAWDSMMRSIEEQRFEKLKALRDKIQNLVEGGKQNLQSMKVAEMEHRKKLIDGMMEDIRGNRGKRMPADPEKVGKRSQQSALEAFFAAPLKSFEYMAHAIDRNHFSRDGWFYNYFVKGKTGVMAAQSSYLKNYEQSMKTLNEKTEEIFGKKAVNASEEGKKATKDHGITMFVEDADGNISRVPMHSIWSMEPIDMSKNQATYLYMVSKMNDGMAKLYDMGFDETSIEEIKNFIGDSMVRWADYVQEDYLPSLYPRYNAKYTEIYGTPMANIENYVPLRIDKTQTQKESDLQDNKVSRNSMQQKNSFQINRTINLKPIDLTTDCFEVIQKHIQDAEDFNAYATIRKDLDDLFSSNAVINQLNANHAGQAKDLQDAARIAVHSEAPEDVNIVEKSLLKATKGIIGGNIAFRIGTALKQTLSAPVFYGYTGDPRFIGYMTKSLVKNFSLNTPGVVTGTLGSFIPGIDAKDTLIKHLDKGQWSGFYGDMKWAMDNIPSFKNRVSTGDMGNDVMNQDLGFFDKFLSRGMTANQLIDAVTCVSGIKAIYDYEMARMQPRIDKGEITAEEAHNMACTEADIFYNGTQQSSHRAFMSPVQTSQHAFQKAITAYQNASIGFARKATEDLINLYKAANRQKMLDSYARTFELAGMDAEEARKAAEKKWSGAVYKSTVRLGMFGFLANFLWDLGGRGLFGMFQNDDQKDQAFAWQNIPSYFMRGTYGTNIINGVLQGSVKSPFLLYEELGDASEKAKKLYDDGGMSPELAEYAFIKAMRIPGMDLEVLSNFYLGAESLAGKGATPEERMLAMEFLINLSKGNRKSTAAQIYKDMPLDEQSMVVLRAGKVFEQKDWRRWLPGASTLTEKKYNEVMTELAKIRMTDAHKNDLPISEKEMDEMIKFFKTEKDLEQAYDTTMMIPMREKIVKKAIDLSKDGKFNDKTWKQRAADWENKQKEKKPDLPKNDTDVAKQRFRNNAPLKDRVSEKELEAAMKEYNAIFEEYKMYSENQLNPDIKAKMEKAVKLKELWEEYKDTKMELAEDKSNIFPIIDKLRDIRKRAAEIMR